MHYFVEVVAGKLYKAARLFRMQRSLQCPCLGICVPKICTSGRGANIHTPAEKLRQGHLRGRCLNGMCRSESRPYSHSSDPLPGRRKKPTAWSSTTSESSWLGALGEVGKILTQGFWDGSFPGDLAVSSDDPPPPFGIEVGWIQSFGWLLFFPGGGFMGCRTLTGLCA